MRIGLIVHPFGEKEPSGLGRSIYEIARHLVEGDTGANEYVLYFKGEPPRLPSFTSKNWRAEFLPTGKLWLDRGFRAAAQADVYIFFTPVMPFWHTPPAPTIVVAHDFSYLALPSPGLKTYAVRAVLRLVHGFALRRADAVVAVSEATRTDVLRYFCLPPQRVKVIYNGYTRVCDTPAKAPSAAPSPFFLFVGVVKPRKNVLAAVQAFLRFKRLDIGREYSFVIAGKGGGAYEDEIRDVVRAAGMEEYVHFLGHVLDAELSYLYQNATAFVFPSLFEGFGMPLLEAMACEVPVITSNTDALAEVAGNAAVLVSPTDVSALQEALVRVATDVKFRRRLVAAGKRRARQFSWDKTAESYRRLAQRLSDTRQR